MALNKAYNQYKQNSIYTSTPEELTLMLYNGLIKFIMQAQGGIEYKDIEKAANSIVRAQDIVLHFRTTLDMKYEVSQGLDALYEYMYRRLVEANIKKDQEILDEILSMSRELRDTWAQAMKLAKHPQQPFQQPLQQPQLPLHPQQPHLTVQE
jgi:flagellar protein FliS